MAYRGRGRGRFGGGRHFYSKEEPFVLFPDIELPDPKAVKEERTLVAWNARFARYWESSPYFLEETVSKKQKSVDIERFSDRGKPKSSSKRDSFQQFLQLGSKNFPQELTGGLKMQPNKKVRWNTDPDLKKLDLFEKLEQKYQGLEEKGGKDKKEGGDEEDEEDVEAEEADEEFSDDGDYNQNIDFDDDEDDFNMDDNDDDEPIY